MADNSTKGPSKKELNKLARKEGKKKEGQRQPTAGVSVATAPVPFSITFCKTASPELTRAVELYLGDQSLLRYLINKSSDSSIQSAHLPILTYTQTSDTDSDNRVGSISGDLNIARYLVRHQAVQMHNSAASALYGGDDPWLATQVDQWLDLYLLWSSNAPNIKQSLPTVLSSHLSDKTYLVGSSLTLADISMWLALKKSGFALDFDVLPHASRWFGLLTGRMPVLTPIPVTFQPTNKPASTTKGSSVSPSVGGKASEEGPDEAGSGQVLGSCPPLEGAV